MEKIVILMEDKKEKQDINELFRKENIEIYFGDDENGVLKLLGEKMALLISSLLIW